VSRVAIAFALAITVAHAQKPENVLVVINQSSPLSQSIGEYYILHRRIPLANVCRLKLKADEEISRESYDSEIARPVSDFLKSHHLEEKVLYIVTTSGVPLRIQGTGGRNADTASVDSELSLLYYDLRHGEHPLNGSFPNPFFSRSGAVFRHPDFPIYLVTRLTGYDFADVRGIIDRALHAMNLGKFVIDLRSGADEPGNDWLRAAARVLPKDRVVLDESSKVLYDQHDVIAYASWGSNDANRKERHLRFTWLPGAIMTEFVSTNARTLARPPDSWNLGTWNEKNTWFAGSPQSMTADYIHDGATGASGHVSEPYLQFTPRPDFLLPAYYQGRTLAESYYLAIPALSWMNIVVGDPLCTLGPP
jgi:uncharacterized protein (TIGR03790 family)